MSEGGKTKLEAKWAIARDAIGNGRLSVIMPVYNLAGTIEANVAETARLFDSHGIRAELVPVDDGSTDDTAAALARAAEPKYEHVVVRPVICQRNGGKGAALRAGFDASTGEYAPRPSTASLRSSGKRSASTPTANNSSGSPAWT